MSKFPIQIPVTIQVLTDEIYRDDNSRYHHRLHCLFLVAQGWSAREVAVLFGDSPRVVQYWVSYFEQNGLQGIVERDRCGRPTRLQSYQIEEISLILHDSPERVGLSEFVWHGELLSSYLKAKHNLDLGVRQCQRLLRKHKQINTQI